MVKGDDPQEQNSKHQQAEGRGPECFDTGPQGLGQVLYTKEAGQTLMAIPNLRCYNR